MNASTGFGLRRAYRYSYYYNYLFGPLSVSIAPDNTKILFSAQVSHKPTTTTIYNYGGAFIVDINLTTFIDNRISKNHEYAPDAKFVNSSAYLILYDN